MAIYDELKDKLGDSRFMHPLCITGMVEINTPGLPLSATADGWEEFGRMITEEDVGKTLCGLRYYPVFATAPFSQITP